MALYSGTLGRKHDAGKFLVLAERIRAVDGHIVVISQGPEAEVLAREAETRHPNLHVLPFQPWEELPAILASASVLLAVLHHEAAAFSVPSKVLTYLCAGRPIVAAMSSTNLAADHIREADAGLVVDPEDDPAFAVAVLSLLADPEKRSWIGRNARAFAERAFDIEPIADRFEDVFEHRRPPARATRRASLSRAYRPHGQVPRRHGLVVAEGRPHGGQEAGLLERLGQHRGAPAGEHPLDPQRAGGGRRHHDGDGGQSGSPRIASTRSSPESRGISASVTTRSGRTERIRSRPEAPSSARCTT